MSYFSPKENDNVHYLLLSIDSFSKKVFLEKLINKKADTVLEAFDRINQKMSSKGKRIKALCTGNLNLSENPSRCIFIGFSFLDLGSEFINTKFQKYLSDNSILLKNSKRLNHCPTSERANKSLQTLIGKFCTRNKTQRYIDHLTKILSTYNSCFYRSLI